MMPYIKDEDFFPVKTDARPMIYAYTDEQYPGCLKVGYTTRDVDKRVAEQYPVKRPYGSVPYQIVLREPAIRADGSSFMDHDVHAILRSNGFEAVGGEWFHCTVDDVKAAIVALKTGTKNVEQRTQTFKMRPEQADAVEKTIAYYKSVDAEGSGQVPKFLWNAKMRFGKTFTTYQLAKKMGFTRVLILTFKPAVESAWHDDLMHHIDFEGWQFIAQSSHAGAPNIDVQYQDADKTRPIVCFGSFQDFLGIDKNTGGIKPKNAWVHTMNWDLVVFDEYHFGAWTQNAKNLFHSDDDDYDNEWSADNSGNTYDETWLPITTSHYLFLSGTPFRALNSGEFIEDQIYNWTYSDEQQAKADYHGADNPYAALPRMVMLTYKLPDSIQRIAQQGEFDEFDLNVFFSAAGEAENAQFVYKDYVQKWLDLIRGSYLETSVNDLKLGAEKPPMPYADTRLLNVLSHTLWFLPTVASCYAMANLLAEKQNAFYHDYTVNVCAGTKAGIGAAALTPVLTSMGNPLETKTITLSCGKLTTGVTVKPWTGIFMLRNLQSPETYFQAAFRVQSPWEITNDNGHHEIVKKDCYLFDFALNRALRQISDYSCRLNVHESNPEKKVSDFINFLPVLAYDGSAMRQVDAGEILDIAMAGTSATLLAKRWESALLVNVDNTTLARLMANKEAMDALMHIEGFRSLNQDIETIINKSEHVKNTKKNAASLTSQQKKELSQEEKEYKSKRKHIQEKLIKFATRIPVFMYLTDYREYCLEDVITKLEPDLFRKVTGLHLKDFELLLSLNVFNGQLMNEAIYHFKRYEDASLSYAGIDKHDGEAVGLFNTVISRDDYEIMASQQASSMTPLASDPHDMPDVPFPEYTTDNEDEEIEEDDVLMTPVPVIPRSSRPLVTETDSRNSHAFSQSQKPQPNNMVEMKVGMRVNHVTHGVGTIIQTHRHQIMVEFQQDGHSPLKENFAIPSAFHDGFLRLLHSPTVD